MKREFKGIWIPAGIWCDRKLNWAEKIMLREIDSLNDRESGGCYASNGYFSEFFGLSKSRVSEIISGLTKKKYIRTMLMKYTENGHIKTRRLLRPTGKSLRKTEPPPSGNRNPYSENRKGYSENSEYSNTVNNKRSPDASAPMSEAQAKKIEEKMLALFGGPPGLPGKHTKPEIN